MQNIPFLQRLPLFILFFSSAFSSQAQDSRQQKKDARTAQIAAIVDSQTYIFKAQQAMPMSGRTMQLTSDYDLKITPTAVISYLPYYGRAYSAPVDPGQGGIQFTSKDFIYTASPRKKGGWDIVIKPKDFKDVQRMTLSISEAGYASLQVTSTNRQAISFQGYIVPVQPPKKKPA